MIYQTISTSEGRKNLPKIIEDVDKHGKIYIFTIHGKAKVALVDLDLLNEFIENVEYGISESEIRRRAKEKTISLDQLKKKFAL